MRTRELLPVEVVFSEPLAASSIQAGGSHFTIDNGVAVSSASLQPDNVTVVLTTTALADLTPYTVTVTGVMQ